MDEKKVRMSMMNDSSEEMKALENELEILKRAFMDSKGVEFLENVLERLEKLLDRIEVKLLWMKRK